MSGTLTTVVSPDVAEVEPRGHERSTRASRLAEQRVAVGVEPAAEGRPVAPIPVRLKLEEERLTCVDVDGFVGVGVGLFLSGTVNRPT